VSIQSRATRNGNSALFPVHGAAIGDLCDLTLHEESMNEDTGKAIPVQFFAVDGQKLAGTLTLPKPSPEGQRLPAVLLCQGLSGVKTLVLPTVASALAVAGFASLAFDYRGYGESEGDRGWILPHERVDDALLAFAYLAQRPEIDPDRLGCYGLSLGGPVALSVATLDQRVRSVVSVSGPASGEAVMRSLRTSSQWLELQERIQADRAIRATTGSSTLVPLSDVVPFSRSFLSKYAALSAGGQSSAMSKAESAPAPQFWFAGADALVQWHPEKMLSRIAPRPVLLVSGALDDVATVKQVREVSRGIGSRATWVLVPGHDHVDLDAGPGLEHQVGLATAWFRRLRAIGVLD
jgi:pimeloyl-ACP methyl ester carboxylesterase